MDAHRKGIHRTPCISHLNAFISFFFFIFYSLYFRVTFNWKRDWHNSGFEVLELPERTDPAWARFGVCEAARAAGQWRQTGRETEVIWRDKTSSDMTCWSGSKHRRYTAEPTQEHRSPSFFVSFLLSFSPLYQTLFITLPLPLFSSLSQPPSVSPSLLLSICLPSLLKPSAKAELVL